MKKNIVITGGSGFLGSNFIKKFYKKFNIIYNFDIYENKDLFNIKNVKFVKVDITKKIKQNICSENISLVVHTAAKQPIGPKQNLEDFIKVNVDGIKNILKFTKENKIKKFINCSSFSVYGKPKKLPVYKKQELTPSNFYGLSKLLAEKISQFYSNKYKIKNIILRFDGLYGYGQNLPGFIDFAIKQIKLNKDIELFSRGKQVRDQIYINDAIKVLFSACSFKTVKLNEIFNVGGGNPKNNLVICSEIKKSFVSKSKILLLNKKNSNFDYDFYMSLIETKKKLGYKPTKFHNILKQLITKYGEV